MGSDEIGAVAAAKGGPVSMTLDDPVYEEADPMELPPAPAGIEVTPDELAPTQPFFETNGDGFLLLGSTAREDEPRITKGYVSSRADAPLGLPASAPLAVGFASFAALAWKAILDLLRSLR